ncbi:hypothetical protein ACLOJK_004458, partial [Asimina triloba]
RRMGATLDWGSWPKELEELATAGPHSSSRHPLGSTPRKSLTLKKDRSPVKAGKDTDSRRDDSLEEGPAEASDEATERPK